VCFY